MSAFRNLEDDAAAVRAAPGCRAVEIARFILDQASIGLEAIGAIGDAIEGIEHRFGAVASNLEHGSEAIRAAEQRRAVEIAVLANQASRGLGAIGAAGEAPERRFGAVRRKLEDGAAAPAVGRRRAEEIARAVRNEAANGKDAI